MIGRPAIVSIRDARVVYPAASIVALEGLTLEIPAGQVVGIVGHNGSGKTTLARLLNGILRPVTGSVLVDGLDTVKHPVQALAAHVGSVFQNPNHQLFAATVAEELAFGPRNLGCHAREVEARVADAADAFELRAVLDEHPFRLGLAVRRRVAIAAVATMRPPLVVMDEPTSGVDHRTGEMIRGFVGRLAARGDTVVLASQDMPLVAETADRVLILQRGRLIADDPPRTAFAKIARLTRLELNPPQITELSMRLPDRGHRPVALTVAELVDDIRRGTGARS